MCAQLESQEMFANLPHYAQEELVRLQICDRIPQPCKICGKFREITKLIDRACCPTICPTTGIHKWHFSDDCDECMVVPCCCCGVKGPYLALHREDFHQVMHASPHLFLCNICYERREIRNEVATSIDGVFSALERIEVYTLDSASPDAVLDISAPLGAITRLPCQTQDRDLWNFD